MDARGEQWLDVTCGAIPKERVVAALTGDMNYDPWGGNNDDQPIDWKQLGVAAKQARLAPQGKAWVLSELALGARCGLLMLMAFSLVRLRREKEGSLLFWFSVPVIGFFLLKSIQGKVQANWALPAYVTGIVAYAAYCLEVFLSQGKWAKIMTAAALAIAFIITSVAHYPWILNLPVNIDPTARLAGWKELGAEVSALYEQMSRSHPVFIFSDRYQVSSQLAFYVRGHPVTYCVNSGRRMNQYDLWPSFHAFIHHHAIFVRTGDVPVPAAQV